MSPDTIPWIIAIASAAILAAAATLWLLRQRKVEPPPMPDAWALTSRPVFSSDERRVYRQLREALPHHIVLSKLPLVRFCQPTDPQQVRYWYELLGPIHVGFAICSANGRVLAAIDIESERGHSRGQSGAHSQEHSRRSLQIKRKVLSSCRVRYLRCTVDNFPSVPELQLLVPQQMPASRAPLGASAVAAATASEPGSRRRHTRTLWQDPGFPQDSLFGAESPLARDTASPGIAAAGGFVRGSGASAGRASPLRH